MTLLQVWLMKMDNKELEKSQFKVYRLKQINDDQKQTITSQDVELNLLRQKLTMYKSKLRKIIDMAYIED